MEHRNLKSSINTVVGSDWSITGHFQSPRATHNNIALDLINPGLGESHGKVLGAALPSHYFVSDLSENTWKFSVKLPVMDLQCLWAAVTHIRSDWSLWVREPSCLGSSISHSKVKFSTL